MILIATASPALLERCTRGARRFGMILNVADNDFLKEALVRIKPEILLLDLDLPQMNGQRGIAAVRKLNPLTKTIVLSGPLSDDAELSLFIAGARGCCPRDIDSERLESAIIAVHKEELWIRRTLTPRLLDELGAWPRAEIQPRRADAGRLAELTLREREIAALVSGGNSNKQIARRLDITERTVKAHLTEIFRKLGVSDRLMLALCVMTRHDTENREVS
jgi:DNA-binding NarL/FixJ family response regulator